MITKIKIALAFALVLTFGVLSLYCQSLKADKLALATCKESLQVELAAARQESERLSRELAANFRALEQREAEAIKLSAEKENLITELEGLYAQDQESYDWAAAHIPASVVKRMR